MSRSLSRLSRKKKPRHSISVVLSGMPSVGKTTTANIIAKKFSLHHLAGGDMLKQIAAERGYTPSGSDWWDTKQGMTFLAERRNNSDFDKEVDRRLIKRIMQGGVVVTSYPIPWICKSGLKLWFAASQRTRAKRLAGRDSINLVKAQGIIAKRDRENRKLYRDLYGIDFGRDLSVFNFQIQTESLSANQVARIALQLVKGYNDTLRTRRREKQGPGA